MKAFLSFLFPLVLSLFSSCTDLETAHEILVDIEGKFICIKFAKPGVIVEVLNRLFK